MLANDLAQQVGSVSQAAGATGLAGRQQAAPPPASLPHRLCCFDHTHGRHRARLNDKSLPDHVPDAPVLLRQVAVACVGCRQDRTSVISPAADY